MVCEGRVYQQLGDSDFVILLKSRQRGSARGQMQKLPTVGKFHVGTSLTSFDHLVGAGEQRRWDF